MDDILKDSRFTKLVNDPRYRQIPKTERKVKIDKRFQSMFNKDTFKVKYTVDKRGRPVNQSSSENLKKYYDLTSEEESDEDASDDNAEQTLSSTEKDNENNESFGAYVLRPKSDSEESTKVDDKEDDRESEKSDVEEKIDDVENNTLICGDLSKDVRKKLRDLEVDYARGEGVLFTDSSSEEDSAEEEEHLEHGWGELDADAETTDDATARLAVCNMDWDNIKASDLFVLFNSFLPPGGLIKSITIYPSEYGLKRMQAEELRGPIELTETTKEKIKGESSDDDDEGNEEGSKYHMEKLRQYQLNRLKYYYAVVVCDSTSTANKIYTDCDGIEYESSATKLDLRFIPDDVTFDQEVHDECLEITDVGRYKPRLFTTTALQQAKVELTWDAANPHRTEVLRGAAGGDIHDEDLKNYLNCSSEEESEIEEPETVEQATETVETTTVTTDPISKYKALLQDIEETQSKKKNRDVEMEITWGLGLKEKTEKLVKKKLTKGDKLTPFEELVEKRKEKKKARKLERKMQLQKSKESDDSEDIEGYSSDDAPSGIDMNDSYFAEEFDNPEFKKNKSKKKNAKNTAISNDSEAEAEESRKRAELELLLEDDDGKEHFSLKKIQDAENETKSKRKRKHKEKMKQKTQVKEPMPDGFEIDVEDKRFSALFTSHHYNIDPTDSNFKKTKAMDNLIQEKLKRRPTEHVEETQEIKKPKRDAAMSVLIKSLKRKTQSSSEK